MLCSRPFETGVKKSRICDAPNDSRYTCVKKITDGWKFDHRFLLSILYVDVSLSHSRVVSQFSLPSLLKTTLANDGDY